MERCFSAGMRKDFILSEEEKQKRKKRLEENRNITSQRLSTSSSSSASNILSNSASVSPTSDEIDLVSLFKRYNRFYLILFLDIDAYK